MSYLYNGIRFHLILELNLCSLNSHHASPSLTLANAVDEINSNGDIRKSLTFPHAKAVNCLRGTKIMDFLLLKYDHFNEMHTFMRQISLDSYSYNNVYGQRYLHSN